MEVVTELGLCNQIISSIKTRERVRLFICFGFSSVGGKKGKRKGPVQHKSNLDFLFSSLFPPRPRDDIPRVTAALPPRRGMSRTSGWYPCMWRGHRWLQLKQMSLQGAQTHLPTVSAILGEGGKAMHCIDGQEARPEQCMPVTREPGFPRGGGGRGDDNRMCACVKIKCIF